MTIDEAITIYRNTNRTDFSEKLNRRFQEMADALSEITHKNLSNEQREDIELILDAYVRRNYKDKKIARKALNSINSLLVKHFKYVSKNHYKTFYLVLWLTIGMMFGTLFMSHHPVFFIPTMTVCFVIGILLGNRYDKLAAREGRVIESW